MQQRKPLFTVRRLALDAMLVAIYVVLGFLKIPIGNLLRINLASFSVVVCAIVFSPIDGLIVGFLGEFLSQILGPYGMTPTTFLWCLGETARGCTLGLCSAALLKKWLLSSSRLTGKQTAVILLCCMVTGVLAALCQTFALYVDSTMMGYYTYTMVFGVMVWRILVYVLLGGIFGYLSLPIIAALKKTKFV